MTVEVARGLTRPLAVDVNLDAVTASALTVVGVRVCRCVVVTVVLLACGVPPVARVVVVEDPRDDPPPRDPPEDEPPEEPPPEDEPPEEPPPEDPPPEDPPPEDPPPEDPPPEDEPREPLEDEPAPADPDPERRAILSAPR